MAFSLSPSVDVREFDLSLTIPNLPSSKTGMVIRADWGEALKIKSVTNEADLVANFLKPTSFNYRDWFNAWNFLQYASSLYITRGIDATAENVGIELSTDATGTVAAAASESDMYNTDIAELTLETLGLASTAKLGVYQRYVSSKRNLAVAVCSSAAYWDYPIVQNYGFGNIDATGFDSTNGTVPTSDATLAAGHFLGDVTAGSIVTFQTTVDDGTTVVAIDTTVTGIVGDVISFAPAISADIIADSFVKETTATKNLNVFDTSLQAASGAIKTFSQFFDYTPDFAAGEYAFIGLIKNSDGKYEVLDNESYTLSYKETGRDTEGRNIFGDQMIFNKSKYFYLKTDTDVDSTAGVVETALSATVPALDDTSSLVAIYPNDGTVYDPTGYKQADIIAGFETFADPESFDINILLAHELDMNYASTVCESRKDAYAVVAPFDYASIVGKSGTEATSKLIAEFGSKTLQPGTFWTFGSYSAVYANMKYQYDKFNDVNRWMMVSGDLAGLAAQTDSNRDPWWAIAGLERGKIKNVIKMAFNANKANRDDLYVNALNPIISIPGEGAGIVYGQKTATARPSAFDRLNVRRLLITLEKAIATASRYALFEFNDEFTRARLRGLIEPFLRDVKGRRGIYDFRVVIDESNNTAEVIDKNALVIDVYIKPTRVAEFIQINMKVTRTDANFDELIG